MQFNKLIIFVLLFSSCVNKNIDEDLTTVNKAELVLRPNEGLVYQKDKPFTGVSILYYNGDAKAETIEYKNGKKHGAYKKWFANGQISYEANYVDGKLDGTIKSWWGSGVLRSEAHYVMGIVNGIQKQWYASGAIFKERNIVAGKEEGLQKAWRENGKIYNNYEAKNGRIFGLKRANLCYGLKDEEIQYEQ